MATRYLAIDVFCRHGTVSPGLAGLIDTRFEANATRMYDEFQQHHHLDKNFKSQSGPLSPSTSISSIITINPSSTADFDVSTGIKSTKNLRQSAIREAKVRMQFMARVESHLFGTAESLGRNVQAQVQIDLFDFTQRISAALRQALQLNQVQDRVLKRARETCQPSGQLQRRRLVEENLKRCEAFW